MLHAPAAATAGCCLFGQTSTAQNCIQFIIFHTGLQGVSGLISESHEALCRLVFPSKKSPLLIALCNKSRRLSCFDQISSFPPFLERITRSTPTMRTIHTGRAIQENAAIPTA